MEVEFSNQPPQKQFIAQNSLIRNIDELSFASPTTKRRRVSDPWKSSDYDEKPLCKSASRFKEDQMDELGRRYWSHSNTFPIEVRPLCTTTYCGK
mmetsp:Transcript_14318/g.18086  ORF Transcript_14318/g.18086 Transcript_14318/m.18086 type:complete len:95 (-) Transcript_14318:13-297(-)